MGTIQPSRPKHSVWLACDNADFCRQDVWFSTTLPLDNIPLPQGVQVKYYIHGHGSDESSLCGAAVLSVDGLCPAGTTNQNMFSTYLALNFTSEITPTFEGFCNLNLPDALVLLIILPIVFMRDSNCEIFSPNRWQMGCPCRHHPIIREWGDQHSTSVALSLG